MEKMKKRGKRQTKPQDSMDEDKNHHHDIIWAYKKKNIWSEGPYENASLFSLCFFNWVNPMLKDMHYDLRDEDRTKICYEQIRDGWDRVYPEWSQPPGVETSPWPLVKILFKSYPTIFIICTLFSFLLSVMEFFNAKIMKMGLKELEKTTPTTPFAQKLASGGKLIFALIASKIILTIIKAQNSFLVEVVTLRIRNGLNAMIYQKVLQKSLNRDTTFSIGEIVTITQTDTSRLSSMNDVLSSILVAPFETLFGLVWLAYLTGKALVVGLLFMAATLLLNVRLTSMYKRSRKKFSGKRDVRAKLIHEVFGNIRFVKMCGLENHFFEKILEIKAKELKWLNRFMHQNAYLIALNNSAPTIFLAGVFGGYIWFYGDMSVSLIFTVIQVFKIFSSNFKNLPDIISFCVDFAVSAQRITFFLLSENIQTDFIKYIDVLDDSDRSGAGYGASGYLGDPNDATQRLGRGSTFSHLSNKDYEQNLINSRPGLAIQIKNGNFFWVDPDLRYLYEDERDRIAASSSKYKKKKKKKSDAETENLTETEKIKLKKKKKKEKSKKKQTKRDKKEVERKRGRIELRKQFCKTFKKDSFPAFSDATSQATISIKGRESNWGTIYSGNNSYSRLNDELLPPQSPGLKSITQLSKVTELYQGIQLTLKNLNIKIKQGQCVGIIGKVGSGKSSLLKCLGGELYHMLGTEVKLDGRVAYVGQKPWIMSKSIEDNILFGEVKNEKKYKESIKFSGLEQDLKILPHKDKTMLGDKGVNLSGGQKARLSLARAMYSNSEIYLLDDPISALDIDVGKFVMEQGIVGYLRGKTRVVATHAISYLKFFDYIYVLESGEIIEEGSYQTLLHSPVFKEILESLKSEQNRKSEEEEEDDSEQFSSDGGDDEEDEHDDEDNQEGNNKRGPGQRVAASTPIVKNKSIASPQISKKNSLAMSFSRSFSETGGHSGAQAPEQSPPHMSNKKMVEGIIQSEDRVIGSMSWRIVGKWIVLIGGFPRILFLVILMTVLSFASAGNTWFLQYWATNFSGLDVPRTELIRTFLMLYLSINGIKILCDFGRAIIVYNGNLEMAREVNFLMTFRLLHASINKFFDRVPMGRILNRYVKDVKTVDTSLAKSTNSLVALNFECFTSFTVACLSSSYYNFFFVVIYIIISLRVQRYYMNLAREISRMKAMSSSPAVHQFKEALDGVSTIRTFEKYDVMFDEYLLKVDDYQKNALVSKASSKWFNLRVSLLSLIIVVPCLLGSMLSSNTSVGIFAFMLNYLLSMTKTVNRLLRKYGSHENSLISLERCTHFMSIKPEKGYKGLKILENLLRRQKKGAKQIHVGARDLGWPSKGYIRIQNLSIKYRKDLPWVLKNVSLDVPPGTKVGIVGRTGAGKTTLISSVYRTFNKYRGKIEIDGHEIRKIDLKLLRFKMTIIPQDPYLFEDTVRNNMDPIGLFSDQKIKDILKEVDLWSKFEDLDGVETFIDKGGSNLSQGEKQLLCLARALLRRDRVVLMDEATANIDSQTELVIQGLIKERFKDSTILMIAHRLNTILHCDKVLVMDNGRVIEYGSVDNLRDNENSVFGKMIMKNESILDNLK